jgi:hypothetical protein
MAHNTPWVLVAHFDRPADEYFAAFDAFLWASGTAAQRFVASPAEQAIYLTEMPQEEHGNWQLDPAPQAGAVLAVSQATPDEAIEDVGKTIGASESLQCARVIARTRVPEGRGHLQGRARWFSQRHTSS